MRGKREGGKGRRETRPCRSKFTFIFPEKRKGVLGRTQIPHVERKRKKKRKSSPSLQSIRDHRVKRGGKNEKKTPSIVQDEKGKKAGARGDHSFLNRQPRRRA